MTWSKLQKTTVFQLTFANGQWHGIPYFFKIAGQSDAGSISHILSYVQDPTLSLHGAVNHTKPIFFFTVSDNCKQYSVHLFCRYNKILHYKFYVDNDNHDIVMMIMKTLTSMQKQLHVTK